MTRRAARLARVLVAAGVLLAVTTPRLNGAVLLAELLIWLAVAVVIGEGRKRYHIRYGSGPKARAQSRREWR